MQWGFMVLGGIATGDSLIFFPIWHVVQWVGDTGGGWSLSSLSSCVLSILIPFLILIFRIHRPDVRGGGRHVLQSQGLVLRARRAVQASLGDAQGL